MKQKLLLLLSVGILLCFQSCLISREPQHDLRNMNIREVYDVRTVRVPMFIARPVVKIHLKSEHCSKELRSYVNRIKAVRVTMALTRPGFNMEAFRTMATQAPYQSWVSVNAYGNMVYINAVEKNNTIRKLNVVVAAKDNALVYAMVKCRFTPDELSTFINLLMSDDGMKGWTEELDNKAGRSSVTKN